MKKIIITQTEWEIDCLLEALETMLKIEKHFKHIFNYTPFYWRCIRRTYKKLKALIVDLNETNMENHLKERESK